MLDGTGEPVDGLIYVARPDNPAFLGPASLDELAAQISEAQGPSGSNRDYLLALAEALHGLDSFDPHVHELAVRVDAMVAEAGAP
jgi:cation transport regulator ChaC